jgi:signal transduction histidine kinase/ligand-binding sensor domain-containing protein
MFRACALAATLATVQAAWGLDPHRALSQYSRTVWTQQHGLPQDTIRAITQTSDGYLWLGTDEGLARFDGYDFVTFRKTDGLLSNSITALTAGRDGSLWIGTRAGLSRYLNRRFQNYTRADGLPDDSISSLFIDHAGLLWIAAGGHLSRFDGSAFTNMLRESAVPMRSVRAIAEDRHHTLYVAGNNAVVRMDGSKFTHLIDPSELRTDFPGGIQVDRAGHVWVEGVRGLIELSPDGALRRYSSREGLPDSFGLNGAWEDRDGNLWAGTNAGLARLENGRFTTEGVKRESIRCLFEDREGNLWAGTTGGLVRYSDTVFKVYGKPEGLPSDEPNTIYQDRHGRIWIGFLDGRLVRSNPQPPWTFKEAPEIPPGRVYAIHESRNGELLIATRNGLVRWREGSVRTFVPPDPQGRKSVYEAIEDSEGRIWLALPNGLGRLRGDKFESLIQTGPLLLESSFVTLAAGPDGSIWAGSISKGLFHVNRKGETHAYTAADGLGSEQLRSVYVDPDGTLWAGTLGGGLNAFRDGKLVRFTAGDGLLSDNITHLLDDRESLWLSTTRGICQVSKNELREFTSHHIKALHPVNYGVTNGLRSAQCSPEVGGGGMRDRNGNLWFVTTRGAAVYSKLASARSSAPPEVHLIDMSTEGRPLANYEQEDYGHAGLPGAVTDIPQIPPGSGRVQFRYSAIHLAAPEAVRYSYKLEPLEKDWVRAGPRRGVNYNSLAHGAYRFSIRAELPDGTSGQATYQFAVLPYFYETTPFRALEAVLAAGLIWMLYRLRVRQIRSRYALVLEERGRIARELHDTLAQGFVGIASQLDVVDMCLPDAEAARESLSLARKMARHSLTEARRSLMDLRAAALDGRDVGSALQAAVPRWTAGSGVEAEVQVSGNPNGLTDDIAQHVFRIAQEAVTNTVKHARATKLSVSLCRDSRSLFLCVADNGCGFQPDQAFDSSNGNFGLLGIRERAESIGGELRLETRPGEGTRLELKVPGP